jgi:hypothetical protein
MAARPLTAGERTRSVGANSRIRIAQIGCGNRGRTAHMEGVYTHVGATNFGWFRERIARKGRTCALRIETGFLWPHSVS